MALTFMFILAGFVGWWFVGIILPLSLSKRLPRARRVVNVVVWNVTWGAGVVGAWYLSKGVMAVGRVVGEWLR